MKKNTLLFSHLSSSKNHCLQQMLNHIATLQQLNEVLKQSLPDTLAQHCWVVNFKHHHLSVAAENANWGLYLRYQQQKILNSLRQHALFNGLKSIQVMIRPRITSNYHETQAVNQLNTISSNNAKILKDTAANITDLELQEVLYRLAKHGSKADNNER